MIKYLASVDADNTVLGSAVQHDPDDGPAPILTPPPPGERYEEIDEPFIRDHSSPTAVAKLVGRTVVWIETASLDQMRMRKIEEMNQACRQKIIGGFVSSALGEPYTYPANNQDQANLVASVTDSLIPGLPEGWVTPFWCVDNNGVWAFRPHSAAQIQRVGKEGKAAILEAMTVNENLRTEIMTADLSQLESITWPL